MATDVRSDCILGKHGRMGRKCLVFVLKTMKIKHYYPSGELGATVVDTMTIKIGGQVFKGLKWYVDEVGYHSGPFHIVEQCKDTWDVYVDSDKALHQNSLAECITWCNNHARQALVFSSRLVVIE